MPTALEILMSVERWMPEYAKSQGVLKVGVGDPPNLPDEASGLAEQPGGLLTKKGKERTGNRSWRLGEARLECNGHR